MNEDPSPPPLYDELKEGHFRLLYVEPADEGSDESSQAVRMTMKQVRRIKNNLDEHGGAIPEELQYTALSYTWGTQERTGVVYINEHPIPITPNLQLFLRLARHHEWQPLWVDALCINQQNNPEKGVEVSHMMEYYRNAYIVLVWLGNAEYDNESTGQAIQMLHTRIQVTTEMTEEVETSVSRDAIISGDAMLSKILQSETVKNSLWNETWLWDRIGDELLKKEWWNRIWTIQEIAVARRPIILCGTHHCFWEQLQVAEMFASAWRKQICRYSDEEIANGKVFLPNIQFKSNYRRRLIGDLRGQRPYLPLLELLMNNSSCEATNPRDYVYGLLGICTDYRTSHENAYEAGLPFFFPDYTATVSQVYTKLVQLHINQYKNLDILSFSQNLRKQNVPSWVPDWSNLKKTAAFNLIDVDTACRGSSPFAFPDRYIFKAGTRPSYEHDKLDVLIVEDKILVATGLPLDEIVKVANPLNDGRPPNEGEFYPLLNAWEDMALGEEYHHRFEPYPPDPELCTVREAFVATITCCQNKIGSKIGPKIGGEGSLELRNILDWKEECSYHGDDYERFVNAERAVFLRCHRRCFFVTRQGYFGLGPMDLKVGDHAFILDHFSVPAILRKTYDPASSLADRIREDYSITESWQMVGESFILGVMNGEALKPDFAQGKEWKKCAIF